MRVARITLAGVCLFVVALVLPVSAAGALKTVQVGVRIHDLNEVDELHERWDLSGTLITSWMEPKLKYRANSRSDDHRDVSANAMQIPSIGFANAIDVPTFHRVDLFVRPNGRVFKVDNFRALLSTHLDLRHFPFDTQNLPLIVLPLGHDVNHIMLIPDAAQSGLIDASFSGLSQWRFLGLAMHRYTESYFDEAENGVKFDLQVQRNSQSYVWKFIIPLCLIVVISWISFWLAPAEFRSKDLLGTAVTTLLIVVAFTLSITALLPRTSYLTYIDGFLLTCILFVIAAIASTVGISALELKGKHESALSLRRIAGAALPLTFILVQIAVFIFYQ